MRIFAAIAAVVSLFANGSAFQSSSESANPFNQFMSPSGGVNPKSLRGDHIGPKYQPGLFKEAVPKAILC